MFQFKSIQLYFLSLFKLISINIRKIYYNTTYYDNRIREESVSRINYFPSVHLLNALLINNNEIYKIPKLSFNQIWNDNKITSEEYNNLHNFLWLTKIDRKEDAQLLRDLLISWINNFNK